MSAPAVKRAWFEAEVFFSNLSEIETATPVMTAAGFEVDPRLDWRGPEEEDNAYGVFIMVRMQMPPGEEDAFRDAVEAVIEPYDCFLSCSGPGWTFCAYPTGYAPLVIFNAEIVFTTQPCADAGLQALAAGHYLAEPFPGGVVVVRLAAYDIAHLVGALQPIIDPHGGFIRAIQPAPPLDEDAP